MSVASAEEVREDADAMRAAEREAVESRVPSSLGFDEVRRCESGKSVMAAAPEGNSGIFTVLSSSDIGFANKIKKTIKQTKQANKLARMGRGLSSVG